MSAIRVARAVIKIPKRIERGPTDILKALASTVRHVPTEPDQLLQDDPFLLPTRPNHTNLYALSRISGKKTAKFLLNKHPELFSRDDSEPKIRSFLAPEEYRDDMDFELSDLKWCVENDDSVNGVIAYNALIKSQVKIDDETLLKFFELICYTNEEKMLEQLEIENNYFLRESERSLVDQSWKNTGIVSKIFKQIKDTLDPPRVYSAMIAGLSKFNEHAAAKQVFDDFKVAFPDKGLYVEAYDGLLSSVPNLNSSVESTHKAIEEIVGHMENNLVKPNLRVFNSILIVYSRIFCDDELTKKALSLVNDMRSLDIEPSLCTYSYLISILGKNRKSQINKDIINELLDFIHLNRDIVNELKDERDLDFLESCMRLFSKHLYNLTLANKLHKIYLRKPTLFRHVGSKQSYLNNYFRLIITSGRLDNIIEFYNAYAPMHFRPSDDNYEALGEVLDLYR